MSLITPAPKDEIFKAGRMKPWWKSWFDSVFQCIFSIQQSGTTAQRPTTNLWVGRRYFDTTLGYPVWLKSTNPIVWVNGSGASV